MTHKLALIGSSHLGAWRTAWDRVQAENPALDVTFFPAPAPIFVKMQVSEAGVFGDLPENPLTRGERDRLAKFVDRDRIDLADFDTVVFVGVEDKSIAILFSLTRFDISGMIQTDRPEMIPASLFARFQWEDTDRTIRRFRHVPESVRSVIVPMPRRADAMIDTLDQPDFYRRHEAEIRHVLDVCQQQAEGAIQAHGHIALFQPDDTKSASGLTDDAYLDEAVSIVEQRADRVDHTHFNAEFGRRMWAALLAELGLGTAAATAP